MPEKDTFIELYQQYKNACCECEYETAIEIYAKMLKELEEGHEWLCNAYLGTLLSRETALHRSQSDHCIEQTERTN